jgi:4-carboxymuconolactone decarboxylase
MTEHPIGLDHALTGGRADQLAVYRTIETGPRGSVPSPFLAMLDAPLLADVIQQVGATIRFCGTLSDADRELAILTTAGVVGCGYEWSYHAPIAERAGLDPAAIAATRAKDDSSGPDARTTAILRLCRSVVRDRRANDALLADVIAVVGREGATELIAICGYYALLASFIIIGGHDVDF